MRRSEEGFCAWLLLDRFCMASLAINERKGNGAVAGAAIFTFVDIGHGIFGRALFDSDKNLRMTELAAVPDRMLFMRKDDSRHAFHLWGKTKILLHGKGIPLDGNSGQKINGSYLPCRFSLFPVNPVAKTAFGEAFREGAKIIMFYHIFPQGMAPGAFAWVLQGKDGRTCNKGGFSIMAGPAVIALHVVSCFDA